MTNLTTEEKEELKSISNKRFTDIGHSPTDYELTKQEFIQHEKEVKEYLRANGRYND